MVADIVATFPTFGMINMIGGSAIGEHVREIQPAHLCHLRLSARAAEGGSL